MIGFQNILWFILLIGVMINIHELGHYWAARYFDVKVEAFSFGFGPRLWGWRRGETEFKIAAIPFGGYVKMAGEQPGEENTDPRSFGAKPRWQRLIVAVAGPFMNIVLAVAVLTGIFMVKFPKLADTQQGLIGRVAPESAAAKAGVQEGDRIIALDGVSNPTWDDIGMRIVVSAGQSVPITVQRGGKQVELKLTPILDAESGIGTAGWQGQLEVLIAEVSPDMPAAKGGLRKGDLLISANGQPIRSTYGLQEIIKATSGKPVSILFSRDGAQQTVQVQPELTNNNPTNTPRWMIGVGLEPKVTYIKLGLGDALVESVSTNIKSASMIYEIIRGMVQQRLSPKMLEGPIRIAQLSGEAARMGWMEYLMLMAGVSLNLAVFNLLPIPVLDGGMILVLLFEMVLRRDLSMKIKETVLKLGFVFLMAIVMFVLYNDIRKIMPG